jgi:hypothetical protein
MSKKNVALALKGSNLPALLSALSVPVEVVGDLIELQKVREQEQSKRAQIEAERERSCAELQAKCATVEALLEHHATKHDQALSVLLAQLQGAAQEGDAAMVEQLVAGVVSVVRAPLLPENLPGSR